MYNKKRFKDVFKSKSIKNTDPNVPLLAGSQKRGVILKSDIGYRTVTISPENYKQLKIVNPGDFCITLMSFQSGIEYSNVYGGISSAYTIIDFLNKGLNNDTYYKYYLKNLDFVKDLNRFKKSIRMGQNISFKSISNMEISNPPLETQVKIATYLEDSIQSIDKKIAKNKRKIELMKEYREAIIFETVTKGLDKTVKMKDSGIDWIGEIPKGWKWKRLKNMVSNLGGGNYGEDIKKLDKESILSKCFSISDFKNGNLNLENLNKIKMDRVYKKSNTIKTGTILIEKCGGTKINPVGRIIIVEDDVSAYYTNFVQGVKVNDFMDNKYLYYQLQTTYNLRLHMSNVKQTTGIQNFNFMKFASEKVFLNPPLETQKEIADYLDIETAKADDEIEKLTRKNILLEELRNSLIFEAVTGKIDVGVEGEEYKKIISEF